MPDRNRVPPARRSSRPRRATGSASRARRAILKTFVMVVLAVQACGPRSSPEPLRQLIEPWVGEAPLDSSVDVIGPPAPTTLPILDLLPPTRAPGEPYATPTPDPTREPPATREAQETYVVRYGDSLGGIAYLYGIGAAQIVAANSLMNPNLLSVGQILTIPAPISRPPGPSFKILPDTELVYGPSSVLFDLRQFVADWDGALNQYVEEVEGRDRDGVELVQLVAQRYSVDPRVLLAALEVQSGWVTQADPSPSTRPYTMRYYSPGYEGLFSQLSWAADQLNAGFYRWRAGWAGPYFLADGTTIIPGTGINAGTAAIQNLFAGLDTVDDWTAIVAEDGYYQTYTRLFGNPFDRAIEPLVTGDLEQPTMQLPFEPDRAWSFTGGPHAAWGEGSAWAALDFAPPGYALGCVYSDEWIVAVSDGLILRSDNGEVIQDLDGDGFEQTGWAILYMHVEDRGRVELGDMVNAGDPIGHASCEGGISNGTHLHLARKYNGEWIPADSDLPFVLDGWTSAGLEYEYDGTLSRNGVVLEACSCRSDDNQIGR